MNRSTFLGVILSPVLLLFRRKEEAPKCPFNVEKLLARKKELDDQLFRGTHRLCPDCGAVVERGLMSWMRHNDEFHTTHLQWDGNEVTAPEHLNIHMSLSDLKKLQADLKRPWWEILS